ncbi:hypothetical protein C483_02660 [Natrialba hulunbeirensis JCM 10989]|uniref:Uncharacterized protein n=1 Tax=Natrialba hulunbeirensis JCM 10989 TaxID=1227493 RepID=M0A9M5_9EURY|nr:hypothetical protein [Natrialba hulunbeirensis]ELY94597.1 hypothetical protein C483_02660 [Natrialba hulunbeirensis JCM 10989]
MASPGGGGLEPTVITITITITITIIITTTIAVAVDQNWLLGPVATTVDHGYDHRNRNHHPSARHQPTAGTPIGTPTHHTRHSHPHIAHMPPSPNPQLEYRLSCCRRSGAILGGKPLITQ